MAAESVLNFFEQPGSDGDNTLTIGGSAQSANGTNYLSKLISIPIGNISNAGIVWIVPGIAGTITKISCVIDAAIVTADAGVAFALDGVDITDAALTIAFVGSSGGTVDQSVPTALNVISATQAIRITKDGASTNNSNGLVTFQIEPS